MIKKMQKKFILLTMTALLLVLTVIIGGINIVNYKTLVEESDQILSVLSENRGAFPMYEDDGPHGKMMPPEFSPETPYESRYFTVFFDDDGSDVFAETSRIISVDPQQAVTYAQNALEDKDGRGFSDRFRYAVTEDAKGTHVVFLDCGRMLDSYYAFMRASILMALAGFFVVLVLVSYFSGRIIRPVSESYEKQKQFITDAGHELKTPLTIISADVDVMKMESGESEWLDDIKSQVKKLASLTDDLVYLSRMEEASDSVPMVEFPVSDIVEEAAALFETAAQTQNKKLNTGITPMLSMTGNEKSISQLVSILMDNAMKYSPENSTIDLKLYRQNRELILSVTNATTTTFSKDDLSRIFDRFYRMDQSRNSETGGHGIGLSMAKAIVEAHKGKILATSEGTQLEIRAALPV